MSMAVEGCGFRMKRVDLPVCPPRIRDIVRSVLEEQGVSWRVAISKCRKQKLVKARTAIAMALVQQSDWSYSRIGRLMGRDHTTIMFYLKHSGVYVPSRQRHKLTEDQVRAIRLRQGEPSDLVGADYGVKRDAITAIWRGSAWKQVV